MLLEAARISVAYDGAQVLWDVSVDVAEGEIVALLGPNGSGKSTLMNSISRLVKLKSGCIVFKGREIQAEPPHRTVELGMAHVLERHRLFPYMTVLENLILGGGPKAPRARIEEGLEEAYRLFPRLKERQRQMAGRLSGGEQQMCAIARGLIARPRLLLVDEPFIGLSPQLRQEVEGALRSINEAGVSMLLIEQNVREALRMSHRAYVLRTGRVVLTAPSRELAQGEAVREAFMGANARDPWPSA
jgi:branched-chain amino acid transport system ATP-binding protein